MESQRVMDLRETKGYFFLSADEFLEILERAYDGCSKCNDIYLLFVKLSQDKFVLSRSDLKNHRLESHLKMVMKHKVDLGRMS